MQENISKKLNLELNFSTPSGGVTSPSLKGSMTVIYSNESFMRDIASVKRYIEDDAGLFSGDKVTFKDWINTVNANLYSYRLNIDEHTVTDPGSFPSLIYDSVSPHQAF